MWSFPDSIGGCCIILPWFQVITRALHLLFSHNTYFQLLNIQSVLCVLHLQLLNTAFANLLSSGNFYLALAGEGNFKTFSLCCVIPKYKIKYSNVAFSIFPYSLTLNIIENRTCTGEWYNKAVIKKINHSTDNGLILS